MLAFHASLARASSLFDHAEVAAFVAAFLSVLVACFAKVGRNAFRSEARVREINQIAASLPADMLADLNPVRSSDLQLIRSAL